MYFCAVKSSKAIVPTTISCAIWVLLLFANFGHISMSDNAFGEDSLSVVGNIVTALSGAFTFAQISRIMPGISSFRWLGTHTMPILGFNYLVSSAVVPTLKR